MAAFGDPRRAKGGMNSSGTWFEGLQNTAGLWFHSLLSASYC